MHPHAPTRTPGKPERPPHGSAGLIASILAERAGEQFDLHERHANAQLVRVLRAIGFDRNYVRGVGPHLFDDKGEKYLDLLSGWGTFALGRNHPVVNDAIREALDLCLPNMGAMDASLLAGVLAQELIETAPGDRLDKVFFANSGTETVEGALKFARCATGRAGAVACSSAFHGLTMGSLSLNGSEDFRRGFGPLLEGVRMIPFNDLAALEQALSSRDVAAFVVEPIQGKGVNVPSDEYLREARRLCDRFGTLLVADEVQTGLGRTGRMWCVEHWGVEPDILLTAKALSGGQVPVGAILMRRAIHDAVFSRMERAVVHSSTFAMNTLAMAAGLATLRVLREERLVERADAMGRAIMDDLRPFVDRYEFVKDVRGKGLMIGIEFGKPRSLKLRAAWALLEKANESLFCQMVLMPLFARHRVLAQVAGHNAVIKLLPPLVIDEGDRRWMVEALDDVIAECHNVPGSLWGLGKSLASHALAAR